MTALAPPLQVFFTDRLARQRHASPETVAAYRDVLRLLVCFASHQVHKLPSQLGIDDLDASLIASFLDHLERERGNSVRTRNAGWRLSTPSSAMPPSAIPNTLSLSSGCSPFRPSDLIER
jgi:hypothetical protein